MLDEPVLECVVNVSEGSDQTLIDKLASACGPSLLDVHSDPDHNRSVFTLAGPQVETDVRALASSAVELLDINDHEGVHPRIGVIDVVPFVPLPQSGSTFAQALKARDDFASWMAQELRVPSFLYGPERTLPDARKKAFSSLMPDMGPHQAHPTAGAAAVGARNYLIAYNLWLVDTPLSEARAVAKAVRTPQLRTLALPVGRTTQISCNLIDPLSSQGRGPDGISPEQAYDAVSAHALIDHAELVGLIPNATLLATPRARWEELGLSPGAVIETRLEHRHPDMLR